MADSPVSAVIELLRAGLPADVKVYHSRVTDQPPPARFVIVSGGTGTRSRESFTGRSDTNRVQVRLTITATLPSGSTDTAGPRAEWLAGRCESILSDALTVVSGKRCSTLTHELTRFMGADEKIAISAYYVADFSFTVTP